MNKYSMWQAFYMAFYSKDLYRDVARRWGAKAFLYLLILLALSWVPFTVKIQLGANEAYRQASDKIVTQIPILNIENGQIKTPENRPYIITDPDTHERIAVIDTSGQYKTLEQADVGILVTKTELISQPKSNETRIYQIPANLNMMIDPQAVKLYIKKYLWVIWVFLFIIFTIGSYIYRLIQALIYALIGKIMCAIAGIKLSYEVLLQLSMVAVTPAIILAVIIDLFDISIPFIGLFYFLITMFYLYFAILANKEVDTPSTAIPPLS